METTSCKWNWRMGSRLTFPWNTRGIWRRLWFLYRSCNSPFVAVEWKGGKLDVPHISDVSNTSSCQSDSSSTTQVDTPSTGSTPWRRHNNHSTLYQYTPSNGYRYWSARKGRIWNDYGLFSSSAQPRFSISALLDDSSEFLPGKWRQTRQRCAW